jgi:aspartate-semialdehyde dehydrogenase
MAERASLALVGATGLVGRQVVESLEERRFPLSSLQLYASPRSAGEEINCGSLAARVELLDTARFAGTDLVVIAAGEQVSAEWAGRAAESGALVIDTSPLFVDDPEVPIVVPELNAAALVEVRNRGIVASPDTVAIAAGIALSPLRQAAGLRRVVITTFEPVSGAGRAGIEELQNQTVHLMSGQGTENDVFPHRIAFNLVPQLGELLAGGNTREEAATIAALRRMLDAADLQIAVTRVRVPIFYGAALSVNIETEQPLSEDEVREALRPAPGLLLAEEMEETSYPTPADTIGDDATHVGRLRCDADLNLIDLWIAIDNLRKGSAVNAVQIAELLLRDYL